MNTFASGASGHPVDTDIRRLGEIASELGAERIYGEASALAERVVEGRFYVACIGQFKRGKSTLLNALIGQAVLPAAIVPVTAVPTIVRFGISLGARVQLKTGQRLEIEIDTIAEYVSEEHNPLNARNVEFVEVFVPSSLLASGMCLVDTPGIGSVFANNTATTREFIPHIDAALAVVGADPPISGDELALIEEVTRSTSHVFVVLSKADRFTEQECAEAVGFTHRILSERLHRTELGVYAVSAIEQLETRDRSDGGHRDWESLVTALRALAHDGDREMVVKAAARGANRIAIECQCEISASVRALREPFEDSSQRLADLQSYITRVDYELPRLDAMIGIERQRVSEQVSRRRDAFLATALPEATLELTQRMPQVAEKRGSAFRDAAIALARHIAEDRLEPWFASEEAVAEDLYRQATTRFTELAGSLLLELESSATEDGFFDLSALKIAMRPLIAVDGFTKESRFYFHDVESLIRSASPWRGVVDRVRPRGVVSRKVAARAAWYLAQLLEINTTRVRNDIDERMIESGRMLSGHIRILLQDLLASAERSLGRARAAHADGAEAVALALNELDRLAAEVREIRLRQNSLPTADAGVP